MEKVLGGVDQGAGLRLIYDLKTAYAYGNQFDQDSLLPLAHNLALLSKGKAVAPQALRPAARGPDHPGAETLQGHRHRRQGGHGQGG